MLTFDCQTGVSDGFTNRDYIQFTGICAITMFRPGGRISFVTLNPIRSSHVWFARLPADLGPGVHTLSVQATDEYGQRHEAHKLFEVVGHGR